MTVGLQHPNTEPKASPRRHVALCELLGQPKPAEADPADAWYTFERGVRKTEGGSGWPDVWMKGHFGWVTNGEWETIGVKGVIPGVGFVPEPKGDWHPFDSIADEAEIWL